MTSDNRGRKFNQKMKPYLVHRYLTLNSNEDHYVKTQELIGYLESYGIPSKVRSIYSDINEINKVLWILETDSDFDELEEAIANGSFEDEKAIVYDFHKKGYLLRNRHYSYADIHLICECIYSFKFISNAEATRLVEVMKEMLSEAEANDLKIDSTVLERNRTTNKAMLANLEIIRNAMATERDSKGHVLHAPEQISFKYLKHKINDISKAVERKHGYEYKGSPYKLIINDGNYYVVLYDSKHQNLSSYRIDRMKDIKLLGIPRDGETVVSKDNLNKYIRRTFNMFGGPETRVVLRFETKLLDTMLERFGTKDASYTKYNDKWLDVSTTIEASSAFYGWLCGFSNRVKIVSPKTIRTEYLEYLAKIINDYK